MEISLAAPIRESDFSDAGYGMKRTGSSERARAIYDRLMQLPRGDELSNNEWAKRAGVNTSFFTNVRNGSEPSVGNLRAVLSVVDVTLPEFFADEARGRMIPCPTSEALASAIQAALPGLPKRPDKRARYLAEVVSAYLRIPGGLPSKINRELVADARSEQVLASTK